MSVAVQLRAEERSDRSVAFVLRPQLEAIREHHEGAISAEDPEELHDLRVAVRRTRAVQRQLKVVFPPKRLASFRREFRWVQRATGEARDLDVYVLGFDALRDMVGAPSRPALEPVLEVLAQRRVASHLDVREALASERCRSLLERWDEFLDELDEGQRRRGAAPIGKLADRRIAKLYTRVVKMGRGIDSSSPAEDFHDLRKLAKELRYMLELFGSELHPAETVSPMIRSLKSLQNTLGRHQDREVQVAMLDSLRDSVRIGPCGRATNRALDELIDRLREDELAARDEFAGRFAQFASKSQRATVSHTFG